MTLLIYHCPTAPDHRRWIAQFPKREENLYITIHGATAEIARSKAYMMQEFHALDAKERAGFDLKGKLKALNGGVIEDEDEGLL